MAGQLSDPAGDALLSAAREAFTQALQVASVFAAVVVAGLAVSSAVLLRHLRPGSDPAS